MSGKIRDYGINEGGGGNWEICPEVSGLGYWKIGLLRRNRNWELRISLRIVSLGILKRLRFLIVIQISKSL
jgi:hypothetical protein